MSHLRRIGRIASLATLIAAGSSQAALLGLTANDPIIDVAAGGVIAYNATARLVTISGTPQLLQRLDPFLFAEFAGASADDERLITIQFKVDAAGNFLSGITGPDLVIKGAVDIDGDGVTDFDGILLEAEVSAFGFVNGAVGANDRFDLRLTPTGGLLAHLFAGRDLSITIDGEPSEDYPNAFAGGFASDFIGLAKTVVGTIDPIATASCTVTIDAFCSVEGRSNKQVCRIQSTKSPMHWEHVSQQIAGRDFRVFKYGLHGGTLPGWSSRFGSTPVKFTYVVRNTGTTTISNPIVIDSFDIDPLGAPLLLLPGQSFTLVRTEALRESLVNTVTVTGQSGAQLCMATDSVAIKEKVRKRRQHDDDRYDDKRARDDFER